MSTEPFPGSHAQIAGLIDPILVRHGCDLEELTVAQAGRRALVRIVTDKDGGVTLDEIADLSREISSALDGAEAEFFGATPFTLEVTSPGVDRPLTLPRHWRRNQGRLVSVEVGAEEVTGRITEVTPEGVALDMGGEVRDVTFGHLGPGRVQIEFGRPTGKDEA
jgi:ribosome maturation factor RimP